MNVSSQTNTHKSLIGLGQRPKRVRQFITHKAASEHVASVLRSGAIPWKNEIVNDANSGLPLSVATRRTHSPINTLLLQVAARKHGFAGRWWGTRSNWKELGGRIDEAKEPTFVFEQWTPLEVFCVDQASGASINAFRVSDNSLITVNEANFSLIERLVEKSGADVRVGVGDENHSVLGDWYVAPNPWNAFPFHSSGDYILLQRPELRSSIASHYYTLLHEFVHWSEVRTDWIDEMHLREFVAEIGSGWLASELGCPPCHCRISHDKHLERWLFEMRKDPDYLFRAVHQAKRAFNFIMSIVEGE